MEWNWLHLEVSRKFNNYILDFFNISMPQIYLVDSYDCSDFILIYDLYHLLCLLFYSLSCCYNQYDQICNSCTSSSHIAEGLMTRSINESYFLVVTVDVKSSYFLSDSSNLTLNNIRMSKIVNKCSFSMINMSHDSNDGWFFIHFNLCFLLIEIDFFSIDDIKKPNLFWVDKIKFTVIKLFSYCLFIHI